MPLYSIQAPDGNTYQVSGPAGASQQQVQAEVLRQHPQAAGGRTAPVRGESYSASVKRTGDTLDKTLSRRGNLLDTAGNTAAGAIEVGLNMGTGVVGDIAGAATSLVTQDPAKGKKVRGALTYEPETPSGKAGKAYVGALTQPLGRIAGVAPEYLEKHGYPISAQVVQALVDVAPGVPKALRPAAQAARDGARTIALGYHLRPTDIGAGPVARGAQVAAGTDELAKTFSIKNQPVTTSLVAQELRLPTATKITPEVIKGVIERENKVYAEVGNMGPMRVPPGATAQIQGLNAGRKIDLEVEALKKTWAAKQVLDPKQTLADIDALRTEAKASFAAKKWALGTAQRTISDTLDGVIRIDALSKAKAGVVAGDLGVRYTRARRTIAQAKDVRKALIADTGEVSAKKLAEIEQKAVRAGRPHFTGNLKVVADTAARYPEVFQDGPKLTRRGPVISGKGLMYRAGGVGADIALGAFHPGAAAAVAGTVGGIAAARVGTRAAMGAKRFQRGMAAKAVAPKGGLHKTRAARAAAVLSNEEQDQ